MTGFRGWYTGPAMPPEMMEFGDMVWVAATEEAAKVADDHAARWAAVTDHHLRADACRSISAAIRSGPT